MDFAAKLIRLREERGLSQYEVADRLGIKRPRYNAWEQGLSKPRVDMMNKIAIFFEVSPDYLLGYENAPEWATPRDVRDIKKILEEDLPVMFDGKPLDEDARQRIKDMLTGFLWEAKEMNKKTYGRKKPKNTDSEK
ncbi:helix-turn-helix domain-containing protein [Paenibacillus oleatilyticus]|uniref:helix-turn-helix domain-containing protein n=1 Tax=Paenibacillus oleatilyticus TaxID=2594886 RepID=UPI001C1FF2D0|nr:helix-turn-helix transcriptional regulator [Paenibacillus oleatilyticus]MBU7320313.1 helix-turn-helix domain-containing protein [Paenibacillus oleatilyticus]